ncbi:MAG: FkbM family methyltransferase [Saprospiraceae bacterium]
MLKDLLKKALRYAPFDITANQRYDRLTRRIIVRYFPTDGCSVDVGCHKGEILDLLLARAPHARHYGFEPLPHLYERLARKYARRPNVEISDVALSNANGEARFNYVISNPSYSGLLKRRYDRPVEEDTTIIVQTRRLDDVLPPNARVDLIKIDVEGAELLVLEGAVQTLRRCKPIVVFEYGLGASDIYDATPDKMFDFFDACDMDIYLPEALLKGLPPLSRDAFKRQYEGRLNCYFVARSARS